MSADLVNSPCYCAPCFQTAVINVRKNFQDTIFVMFNHNRCATGVTSDVAVNSRQFAVSLTKNQRVKACYYTVHRQQKNHHGYFCNLLIWWKTERCTCRLYMISFIFSLSLWTEQGRCLDSAAFILMHILVLWVYHDKYLILLLKADNNCLAHLPQIPRFVLNVAFLL